MFPIWLIAALLSIAILACVVAAARGLPGWWLRALAVVTLGVALLNPSLQIEEREPLSDILLIAVDESASQTLADPQRSNGCRARSPLGRGIGRGAGDPA